MGLVKVIKGFKEVMQGIRNVNYSVPFSTSSDFRKVPKMPEVIAYRFLMGPEWLVWP